MNTATVARQEAKSIASDPYLESMVLEDLLTIAFLRGATHAWGASKRLAATLETVTNDCALTRRQAG